MSTIYGRRRRQILRREDRQHITFVDFTPKRIENLRRRLLLGDSDRSPPGQQLAVE